MSRGRRRDPRKPGQGPRSTRSRRGRAARAHDVVHSQARARATRGAPAPARREGRPRLRLRRQEPGAQALARPRRGRGRVWGPAMRARRARLAEEEAFGRSNARPWRLATEEESAEVSWWREPCDPRFTAGTAPRSSTCWTATSPAPRGTPGACGRARRRVVAETARRRENETPTPAAPGACVRARRRVVARRETRRRGAAKPRRRPPQGGGALPRLGGRAVDGRGHE